MNYQRFLRIVEFLKSLPWLEILAFFIAAGNADVLHQYLVMTGSKDTWQLIIAVYSVELLIVLATQWKTIGVVISLALFAVSMVSIHSIFKEHWFGHSGFSIAIFCIALGNYVRHNHWKELLPLFGKKATVKRGRPKKKKV